MPDLLLPPHIAQTVGLPADYSAAKEVAKIQKALFPPFKEQGFVMKGRSFNRLMPDGLVQVVWFQTFLAVSSVYGQFAIEVGVYLPEVWAFTQSPTPPKTFDTAHCDLRQRVKPPGIAQGERGEWEALAHPELIAAARNKTVPEAFAFFDRFADRDRIMADLSTPGAAPHGSGPAPIILAIIEWNRGQADAACQRLETYLTKIAGSHPGHEKYVRSLITRLSTERPAG